MIPKNSPAVKTYQQKRTRTRYYIPQTLASDFSEFLSNDIPGAVQTYQLVKNWYEQSEQGYKKLYIRVQMYADSTKSRYQNTDNNMNIRTDINSGIKKGDYIIDGNNVVYLLDWQVYNQINNAPSRAVKCNCKLQFYRWKSQQTDQYGFLIQQSGNQKIVQQIPCNAYRYDGRPEYSAVSNQPGITANALTILIVQYNEQTKVLKEDDTFIWGNDEYIIVDVDYNGVDFQNDSGVLKIEARKKPGGDIE